MPMTRRGIRITWLDVVLIGIAVAAVAWLVHRVNTELHYHWDWGRIVPNYFFRFDAEEGRWVTNLLAEGFFMTIRLAVWASLLAAAMGVVLGVFRVSNILFLRLLGLVYVELIRNVPAIVFVFIFFFFVTGQIVPLLGIDEFLRDAEQNPGALLTILEILFSRPNLLTNFVAGVIVLSVFEATWVAEIVRAGIESIPKGQWEAGRSIGLSNFTVMRHIILPQAIQKVFPPLAGQFINVVKDSSLVALISIQELTFSAFEVAVSTTRVFEVWISTAIVYFVLCFTLSIVFRQLERLRTRTL